METSSSKRVVDDRGRARKRVKRKDNLVRIM